MQLRGLFESLTLSRQWGVRSLVRFELSLILFKIRAKWGLETDDFLNGPDIGQESVRQSLEELKNFLFRSLHPDLFLGPASDRYAVWIGQFYSKEKWDKRISRRPKVIKGKIFFEKTLPADNLEEYFKHFSIPEID